MAECSGDNDINRFYNTKHVKYLSNKEHKDGEEDAFNRLLTNDNYLLDKLHIDNDGKQINLSIIDDNYRLDINQNDEEIDDDNGYQNCKSNTIFDCDTNVKEKCRFNCIYDDDEDEDEVSNIKDAQYNEQKCLDNDVNKWNGDVDCIFDGDNQFSFHRVNSVEITYEKKKKKAKFVKHYILGDILGEGSYSKVKEAIDSNTLERRAIKIMQKKRLRKIPNGEQNVEREIKLLRELNHKNVIKLIASFYREEKEKLYVIMEYCVIVLQELLDSVPTKRLPLSQAHNYFHQLINGLEYLHSKGVIHKDIKPGNLLINNAGIVKISDFGVSELLDRFSVSDICHTSQGSPAFQAPEIASGAETFSGFKIDVWSSGVTLYNITTGKYPFEGDTIFILFENISKGEFTIPDDVDKQLQDLLYGMLDKNPDKRYSIKDVKNHDWLRRKHCEEAIITKYVQIPAKSNGDQLRRMTVLPYLINLHNPSEQSSEESLENEYGDDIDANFDEYIKLNNKFECNKRNDLGDEHRTLVNKKHCSQTFKTNQTKASSSSTRKRFSFFGCLGFLRSDRS